MSKTGLIGPYRLDRKTIEEKVESASAGVFILGYVGIGGFIPKYVGRSDHDIGEELKSRIGGDYGRFEFDYCDSSEEAFSKECHIFHVWREQLTNEKHPERPTGSDFTCPDCDKSE
ncbi:MAG: hypothetical protein JSV64_04275 [Candidatus Bathyarchaeota archaeon]|jgi:hypothetical protein|nr:MAG: hypothetical protein JSV64_04275 [Candidatus Bathyarchaeota archaeon]